MSETVLLTGATGFLGMEVLARLLAEREDAEVLALVRAEDAEDARCRLDAVLGTLYEAPPADAHERLRALPGDLTRPGLGLRPADRALVRSRVTAIAHCAASVAFTLPLDEARAVNTVGARRVLELAREVDGLRRLLHVSTAYVAGRHVGRFGEDDLDLGQAHRNTYERSKHEAELLLRAQAGDLPLVVARPSIVVGDSATGWTPAFNVIYWPLQAFARGLLRRVPADPGGRVDIVPVDYVAGALVHLLGEADERGTLHLVAGEGAATNAELLALACERLGRPAPQLVAVGEAPDLDAVAAYLPYFDVRAVFDDRRARRVLAAADLRPPRLADYFGRLLDYAGRARWGRAPLTREAARRVGAAAPAG